MHVQSGKAGCAFEISLHDIENDFVIVDEKDLGKARNHSARIPERLRETPMKTEMTLFDVVEKLREAEQRRISQHNRIKSRAILESMKVQNAQSALKQSFVDTYWALDARLREADKRREELVDRIREKAREASVRVKSVRSNTPDGRNDQLDESINVSLIRAAENRNSIIRDLKQRLSVHDAKVERVRKAQAVLADKSAMNNYWQLDQKLSEAQRRRDQQQNSIRAKAGSPTARMQAIRRQAKEDPKEKHTRITEKISEADHRRQQNHNQIKEKAFLSRQKVESGGSSSIKRKTVTDAAIAKRLLKAEMNRQRHLQKVREQQQQRQMKSERVRQTKRVMDAQCE